MYPCPGLFGRSPVRYHSTVVISAQRHHPLITRAPTVVLPASLVAVRLFEDGTLTMGQAARLLGVSVDEFIDLCDLLQVPIVAVSGRSVAEQIDSFDQ